MGAIDINGFDIHIILLYLFTTEAQRTQRMHRWEAMPRVAMWPAPTTWHFIS